VDANHDHLHTQRVTPLRGERTDVYSNNGKRSNKTLLPDKVLILDVDNCLYCESEIQRISGNGIEKQIIQNTHEFGKKMLNLTHEECDKMYQQYGSTVEGIRHKLLSEGLTDHCVHEILQNYYTFVYDRIDMTCLVILPDRGETLVNTGYNHAYSRSRQKFIRDMLQSIPYPIYFASNSPRQHVLRVLSATGLQNVDYHGLLTPDTIDIGDGIGTDGQVVHYPTKFQPGEFFRTLLDQYGPERLFLIDDSKTNVQKAQEVGIQGIVVNHSNNDGGVTLEEALSTFAGHVEHDMFSGSVLAEERYQFSDVKYLESKYHVDMEAINPIVWDKMIDRLVSATSTPQGGEYVRIVDIGAGLLSMLDLMIVGVKEKRPLIERMTSGSVLHYIAYESNENLLGAIDNRVRSLGFVSVNKTDERKDEHEYILNGKVTVRLLVRVKDFTREKLRINERPHVILGCCFADLFDPNELVASVVQFMNYYTGVVEESEVQTPQEILLYFPITFSGTTQFVTPHPFEMGVDGTVIPSDTLAFRLYSQNLIEQNGHNLDPTRLIEAFQNIGASLLEKGQSVWHIDPFQNAYLWKTMLHFFRNSAAFEILKSNLDSVGWLKRAERAGSPIRVMNQDLLFSLQLPFTKKFLSNRISENFQRADDDTVEKIVFIAPYKVGKNVKQLQDNHLGPNQVEVKAICSLISSGTELKIFKGLFDEARLDVNIKGMAEETIKYPLTYGYSLVGIVTRCGSGVVDSESIMGKLVFTFSPHSSRVIVDRNTVHIVPDGISAEDAMFLPSVETAVSIVHDANIRVGERVSVYGQGLIGLLITGILSRHQTCLSHSSVGTVTTFDTISDRLAMSSAMGATQALLPLSAKDAGPFDVSIEVSGNARALQAAIDSTQDGGRIIVGSWYGNSEIQLKLGIDFHRSHKTIKTSQVSTIPAELSALWSKDKRFKLSWELVRLLKPSNLITRWLSLDYAQEAYELLDSGKEIAVSFRYKK